MTEEFEDFEAPCGCKFYTVQDAFVTEPCSLDCELYLYTVEETKRQGKSVTHIHIDGMD
jgi:hypothetical protein